MFRTRLLSGIVLVAIALGVFLTGGALLAVVIFGVSVIAYQELTAACKVRGEKPEPSAPVIVGLVMTLVYYALIGLALARDVTFAFPVMMMVIMAAFLAFLFVYVFTFPKYHANQIMSAVFCFLYGPVMLSFLYLLREGFDDGIYLVWFVFLASWGSDTCAYCVGVLIGKHTMTPKLSPKKSIEGAVGGVAGSAIVGALYGYFVVESVIPHQKITWIFVLISAFGAVISQVGDLAASAIKRNHEIKDYGKLIPGHGGVMDRFDSVIFTAPMIYLLVLVFIR